MEKISEKELLREYAESRQQVDALTFELNAAKARLEDAVLKLHEDLIERGAVKTAVYDGIGAYSMSDPILYASCDKEYEEDLFDFLRDQDRSDLIKPSVHHRSLASFVKEVQESGGQVPDFIKCYFKPSGKFYKGE